MEATRISVVRVPLSCWFKTDAWNILRWQMPTWETVKLRHSATLCRTPHIIWCTAGRLKPTVLPSSGDGVRKCTCSGERLRKSCSQSLYPLTVNSYSDLRNWTPLLRRSYQSGWDGQGWIEMRVGFWWGNLKEIRHLEDLALSGKMILKWILNK